MVLSHYLNPNERRTKLNQLLDPDSSEAYPPSHKQYWNTTDSYLMGNVTPGDMRAIIQVTVLQA